MSSIPEQVIYNCLKNIMDPDERKPITNFIPSIVIKDNIVFFTIEYCKKLSPIEVKTKERLRELCIKEIKSLSGIRDVKVTLSVLDNPNQQGAQNADKRTSLKGVKKIYLIASGKGGVGKSTLAANLSAELAKIGKSVALVDADIYGPSIPRMFGVSEKPELENNLMIPLVKHGVKLMSMGFLVNPDAAAVWRGPMVTKALFQLLRMTNWAFDGKEVDIMVIDTPPGTGDVHLSLAENYIIDGVVMISTPQEVALSDTRKAFDMFNKLHVQVIGMVENMSYFEDEKSKNITYIFGKDGVKNFTKSLGVEFLGEIPIKPKIVECSDQGRPFVLNEEQLDTFTKLAKIL